MSYTQSDIKKIIRFYKKKLCIKCKRFIFISNEGYVCNYNYENKAPKDKCDLLEVYSPYKHDDIQSFINNENDPSDEMDEEVRLARIFCIKHRIPFGAPWAEGDELIKNAKEYHAVAIF